jgi:GxxExxY protein
MSFLNHREKIENLTTRSQSSLESTEHTEKKKEDFLTGKIIGAAIDVHRILGPGLLESAYEVCLIYELGLREIKVENQKEVPLFYKDIKIDCGYRIDLLVEDQVIVEIKSVTEIAPIHEAQLLSYLKLSDCKQGLLINFNVKLLKEGIRRFKI